MFKFKMSQIVMLLGVLGMACSLPIPFLESFLPQSAPTRPAEAQTASGAAPTKPASQAPSGAAPTAAPNAAKGATNYDGDWEGKTSTGTDISFTIEGNEITYVNLSYKTGSCSGSLSKTPDSATLSNNSFNLQMSSSGLQYAFVGTLSDTDAKGTLQVSGTSQVCGAIDSKTTWTAKRDSASSQNASPSTQAEPTAKPSASDADMVKAFFNAVNAKNIDAALDLVDDDVIYTFGSTSGIGADDLRTYLNVQAKSGATFQLSDVQTNPAGVTFTLQMGAAKFKGTALSQDGKIVILKAQ